MSKQLVMEILENLPDTFSIEDFFENLYLRLKAENALNDIEKGDVYTTEEIKKEIEKWK